MGQASMRKWLRRAKRALDCCWCGALLVVNLHSRFMECPTHGEAPSVRHAGESLGEFERLDSSEPRPLRRQALAERLQWRHACGYQFRDITVRLCGSAVRALRSITYESSDAGVFRPVSVGYAVAQR